MCRISSNTLSYRRFSDAGRIFESLKELAVVGDQDRVGTLGESQEQDVVDYRARLERDDRGARHQAPQAHTDPSR